MKPESATSYNVYTSYAQNKCIISLLAADTYTPMKSHKIMNAQHCTGSQHSCGNQQCDI